MYIESALSGKTCCHGSQENGELVGCFSSKMTFQKINDWMKHL